MTSATLWTEARRFQGIEISLIRQVMNGAPKTAINLALGELAFPMPDYLKRAAIDIISQGNAVYTPNAGFMSLREKLAEYYGNNCQADQICICNGAEEAVYLSLLGLVNPGDSIAIPDPDYTAYPAIASIMGGQIVRLPLNEDLQSIAWEKWEALLSSNIKILLFSNPSNPCGFCLDNEDMQRLAAICYRNRIIVVVDEIYRHLYIKDPLPDLENIFANLIRIGGVSKSHCMSGWRIGWVKAPRDFAATIIKGKQYVSTCAPWLSQKLAEIALSPAGWELSESIRQLVAKNQAWAWEALNNFRHRILVPKAGPYLMLKVDGDDLDFASRAAASGVICVPGSAFGQMTQGWIRINVGVADADLQRGLKVLKTLL